MTARTIRHCVWIIRGWATAPPYGELPPAVHRLLPQVDAAMAYAKAKAEEKARAGVRW